jgi:hypothetical protein
MSYIMKTAWYGVVPALATPLAAVNRNKMRR